MNLTTLNFRLKPGRNQSQPEPILTPIPRPHSVYVDCSHIYVPPRAKTNAILMRPDLDQRGPLMVSSPNRASEASGLWVFGSVTRP